MSKDYEKGPEGGQSDMGVSENLSTPAYASPADLGADPSPQPGKTMDKQDLLALLVANPTSKANREQVDQQKTQLLIKVLASIIGLPETEFSCRTIGEANATTRSNWESTGARLAATKASGIVLRDWVFLGRVGVPEQHLDSLAASMKSQLDGACTIGILFASVRNWAPYRIFYSPGREEKAKQLADYFSMDASLLEPIGAFLEMNPSQARAQTKYSEEMFLDLAELDALIRLWRRKKNLILQGPPGVGKTFLGRVLAKSLVGEIAKEEQTVTVQFHQSYSYEDFIRGWRPVGPGEFALLDGVFLDFCNLARRSPEKEFIFVIDEINRGNLSKIFGELMVLLEIDKRSSEYAMPLLYRRKLASGEDEGRFYVPQNVFILGMMNTADRSLAMVDFALRRRFAFYAIRPMFESKKFHQLLIAAGVDEVTIGRIRARIGSLNSIIRNDTKNLGPGFEIGHSFFCPNGEILSSPFDWYKSIIESEIAPLLREYWFDDEEIANKHIEDLLMDYTESKNSTQIAGQISLNQN